MHSCQILAVRWLGFWRQSSRPRDNYLVLDLATVGKTKLLCEQLRHAHASARHWSARIDLADYAIAAQVWKKWVIGKACIVCVN